MAKVKHLVEHEPELKKHLVDDLRNHLYALVDFFVTNISPNASRSRLLGLREVLTADELAARLKVSKSTIEELARNGKMPGAFRIGKHWRFDIDLVCTQLSVLDKEDI